MNWSRYQSNIFAEMSLSDQNLVINALAGSGKSTVIEQCNRELPQSMKVLTCCFNKHIAEAMQKRLPVCRETGTLNSVGWGIVRGVYRGITLNANKNHQFLLRHFNLDNKEDKEQFYKISGAVKRTVSLFKALNFQTWPSNWIEILDTYGVETGEFEPRDQFPEWAQKVFEYSIDDLGVWDFDDQIYQVVRQGLPVKRRDVVFVDEAQDLSPVQIELVKKLGNRTICVGDKHQSLYIFRGADLHAIDRIVTETDAKVLPLSICYRCSKNVIKEAQKLVSEIEAAENAIEGKVQSIKKEDFYKQLDGNELVTCRNTAPLVRECLRQLGRRQKAFVRGRDIGDKLYELIDKVGRICRSDNLNVFLPALYEYQGKQLDKLIAMGRDTEAESLSDRVESITCFAGFEDAKTIQDVFGIMDNVFSDANKGGTEYSSIHRAKGRECDTVYRLDNWIYPSPKTKPHLIQIEKNCAYVEITRAKNTLYTILR